MSLRIGETAPNFQVETTKGQIDFHEFVGNSWVFFFSHPADFTPVCTTEMGRTAQLAEEFSKRNCKPLRTLDGQRRGACQVDRRCRRHAAYEAGLSDCC